VRLQQPVTRTPNPTPSRASYAAAAAASCAVAAASCYPDPDPNTQLPLRLLLLHGVQQQQHPFAAGTPTFLCSSSSMLCGWCCSILRDYSSSSLCDCCSSSLCVCCNRSLCGCCCSRLCGCCCSRLCVATAAWDPDPELPMRLPQQQPMQLLQQHSVTRAPIPTPSFLRGSCCGIPCAAAAHPFPTAKTSAGDAAATR